MGKFVPLADDRSCVIEQPQGDTIIGLGDLLCLPLQGHQQILLIFNDIGLYQGQLVVEEGVDSCGQIQLMPVGY